MTDPRNIAHDKKVQQEKKHNGEVISPDADETVQPGKKPHQAHHAEKDMAEHDAQNHQGDDGSSVKDENSKNS